MSSAFTQITPSETAPQTSAARQKLQSLDPSTGQLLAEFEPASDAEVARIVEHATVAAVQWRNLGLEKRASCLARFKQVLYERREEVVALITREAGKPLVESLVGEVLVVLDTADYLARHAQAMLRPEPIRHHNSALKFKRARIEYEPHGVIGIISPANYPFSIPLTELLSALVAGNAVVLKPSELTPQIGVAIRDLFDSAGFPPGVANVVLGDGLTGRALVASPIQKLIFTGSVPTGKRIQAIAAERLLPTVLELGGKDPMIVRADANLDQASSGAVWGAFTNAGQACLSVERCYVAQEVAGEFIRLCVEKARSLRIGPGDDPNSDVGPLIRERQLGIVETQVSEAVAQGAEVLCGGRRADMNGFFYLPTVLTKVHHGMRLMREETFGPVLPIMTVENDAEAVCLANDSDFGLAASIWTRDLRRGEAIAQELEAGGVLVNDCISYFGASDAPHGGVKSSGLGRVHSRLGLLEMVRVKYIGVDFVPRLPKLWWYGYDRNALEMMRGFLDFLVAPALLRRARGLGRMVANLGKRYV